MAPFMAPSRKHHAKAPAGQETVYLWPTPMPVQPDEPEESYSEAAAKSTVARAAEVYEGLVDLDGADVGDGHLTSLPPVVSSRSTFAR